MTMAHQSPAVIQTVLLVAIVFSWFVRKTLGSGSLLFIGALIVVLACWFLWPILVANDGNDYWPKKPQQ